MGEQEKHTAGPMVTMSGSGRNGLPARGDLVRVRSRPGLFVFESQQLRFAILSRDGMTTKAVDVDILGCRRATEIDPAPLPADHWVVRGHGKVLPRPDNRVLACTPFKTTDRKMLCRRCRQEASAIRAALAKAEGRS